MTRAARGGLAARAALACGLALALALGGCGKKEARAPVGVDDARPRVIKKKPKETLTGHVLTSVGERTIGPMVARRRGPASAPERGAGLVAWVTPPEGTGRRLVVSAIAADGEPRGGERTVVAVPVDTTSLVVGALRGPAPGFVLAWTALTDRGEALWAAVVGDDGVPRGKAIELARTADDIVWVDVVPTDLGAVCLWAEETRGGDANVIAAALDTDGKVRGAPASVARGVTGWHAVEAPGGLAVALVTPARAPKGGGVPAGTRGGALSFLRLDHDGHASGAPVTLTAAPSVSGDVDVARYRDRFVFAWTDRTADEPFVVAAALDDKGAVEPPRKIVEARGGAALIHLASGPAGLALLWEAPIRAKGESRRVHVARFSDAVLGLERRRLSASIVGKATPELAATSTGFAVLGSSHDCEAGSPGCPDAPVLATLLRTDARLELLQREPLAFPGDPAGLAWGLSCSGETCLALAASGEPLARVRSAAVRPRENARRAAPPPPTDGPRVTDVTALASGEPVVDLAAARFGDSVVLATLTAKAEQGASRSDAGGLVLSTRLVNTEGFASPPVVLSTRALAVGGVALAAADKPEDGGAIAWVAREGGEPQVHVTRLDKRGRRTNDVQITTTRGGAADPAIAWAGGGWIVAWVDGRDGNGEVYATKIDLGLNRVAREERITKAPGDASDLVAVARKDTVWLAWADPRESPREGLADLFVSAVRARDAKPAVPELRVLGTAAHSRTPQLVSTDAGVEVAWIEEAPLGVETPSSSGYGAMWARIDDEGKLTGKPVRLPQGGDGAATAVAIEAHQGGLRAVVARGNDEEIALDALALSGEPRATPLLTLDGPPSLDVALVLHEGVLLFNDDGPRPSDKRARRARIAWTP